MAIPLPPGRTPALVRTIVTYAGYLGVLCAAAVVYLDLGIAVLTALREGCAAVARRLDDERRDEERRDGEPSTSSHSEEGAA